ncbi:unnamed protein product [Nippostrongylus brasiliensis]|uniref:DUF4708 domain-containing protein n=1 Tax=Nippostrongylus brasiliensis TaxID=27835 RepID=A0A0N4XYW8_NIPBR|nr:unnamed protein product [Nippostrongylus brasiliensis]
MQLYDAWEYNKTETLIPSDMERFDFLMIGTYSGNLKEIVQTNYSAHHRVMFAVPAFHRFALRFSRVSYFYEWKQPAETNMQSDSTASQPNRIRTESKSSARAHSTPTTTTPATKCSQSEELMPALQAVPYIIPQQKLEGPCLPVSKRSQEAYARSNESASRIEFAQRQKTKMLAPKLRCTTYATQHASSAQTTVIQDASLPSASKFSSGKMFTPPGAIRTRKADYSAPTETGAIRKAPPRGSNHSKGMLPMYNTPMMISKAQLLSNQPLEPFSVEKRRKQREQILVDTSVRECNEWSIYSVSLPTQLHVKCHCFAENT